MLLDFMACNANLKSEGQLPCPLLQRANLSQMSIFEDVVDSHKHNKSAECRDKC